MFGWVLEIIICMGANLFSSYPHFHIFRLEIRYNISCIKAKGTRIGGAAAKKLMLVEAKVMHGSVWMIFVIR